MIARVNYLCPGAATGDMVRNAPFAPEEDVVAVGDGASFFSAMSALRSLSSWSTVAFAIKKGRFAEFCFFTRLSGDTPLFNVDFSSAAGHLT